MRVVRSPEPSSRPTWWTPDRFTPPLSTPTTYTGPHSKSCLKWNRWGDGDWLEPREGWNSSLYFLCYLVFGINWPKSVVFYLYGQTGSYGGSREKLGTDLKGGGGNIYSVLRLFLIVPLLTCLWHKMTQNDGITFVWTNREVMEALGK